MRVRGEPGPHLVSVGRSYNPETKLYRKETEYGGTPNGIQGLSNAFKTLNREHRDKKENGQGRVMVYEDEPGAPVLDKYEVIWEMEQKEIWELPEVAFHSKAYDDSLTTEGAETFRKKALGVAEDGRLALWPVPPGLPADPAFLAMFNAVVAFLRAGRTGYEEEYIVLRRTRTVPPEFASPVNIGTGRLIYSTAQLLLPSDVDFVVPSDAELDTFTNPDNTQFEWGWRRRPSTSIIQGSSNEQSSEFILSLWSLLPYSLSAANADW